ncbi:HAMP domain-containing histidine kinase [Alteromonas sp. ASW11-19]|uniref:histidine kinase n=1 Tax=Alteromonas salexigens TaxID=2982530 RepID=A0ABT2VQ79_9ALTE|nr:HAMP domain-containing sensor histidine kinase [Alteromonas salexigens]MCU7555270.1 HAMP domain-containing histidine kinase [Alteromonas salexigens]
MTRSVENDIRTIQSIDVIPHIMKMLSDATGLRFLCVARVTEDNWTMCAVQDEADFNLEVGDELDIKTTFCSKVMRTSEPVIIEEASSDEVYSLSEIPGMYGFESYFSYPIYNENGEFFGTLCGLDPRPMTLKTPAIQNQIASFAELISRQLVTHDRLQNVESALGDEQAAAKLREQYIAILGHDLRTPLSSLKMGIDFLKSDITEQTALTVLERMDRSSHRMARLLSDVMDFTHGKMGKGIPLHLKNVTNLEALLNHTVAELAELHPDNDICADIHIDGTQYCDPDRLCQLLSNLLVNALLHGENSKPVYVRARASSTELFIQVANGGKAIPQNVQDKLFQPFWRKESSEEKNGLGLGLFIASQIAQAHRGKLDVQSSAEQTAFTFSAAM